MGSVEYFCMVYSTQEWYTTICKTGFGKSLFFFPGAQSCGFQSKSWGSLFILVHIESTLF
jgi:hypothetical protein